MSNPYAAPAADLSGVVDDGQTYTPKLIDVKGRIGRFRYLVYGTVAGLALSIAAVIISGILVKISPSLVYIGMIAYIPALVVAVIMAKRRLNDMDKSAWLCLLMIIPLANLYVFLIMFFGRGTPGSNRYGPAPTENTQAVKIGAWIIIGLNVLVLGFMFTNFGAYMKMMESLTPGVAAVSAPTDAPETPSVPEAPKE